MPTDTLEAKQHAHELIDQLDPRKIHAVIGLLEVMVDDDDDELTEEDRVAIQAGLASLDKNGGVTMEEVLADFGLTMTEFEKMSADQ